MKDFLGRELALDDSVIIMAPKYRSMVLARIIKFTPTSVRVAFMNNWNYSKPGQYTELLQLPWQLVKVDGQDITEYLLKK